ncbi:two-component system sensor histidine kinase DesK [Crossiella equi]|uniref:Two-component system sensor histidine kinase DesK n=1 Tax=Crossiella equi TaxID=130796 RepID=A0ABS5A8P0_9PSEU|nr:hypothetical protein [Crossiella equi]MBP2472584.1 two-component system sensor histidine kinase DesK [Crossiella equi]
MPDSPDPTPRWLPWARLGLVVFLVQVPVTSLLRFELTPVVPGRTGLAALCTALFLPAATVLWWAAAGDRRPRHAHWLLAWVALVVLGATPVLGVDWLAAYYGLITLVLLYLPSPWSFLAGGVLGLSLFGLPLLYGAPAYVFFFGVGGPMLGLSAAILTWLLVAVRRLSADRAELAAQAVVGERTRAGAELAGGLGPALARLAEGAERAARLPGPAAAVHDLVALSRQSLAQVRALVGRYRRGPLRAELDTALALLAAAGVPARLVLPDGPLPDPDEQALAVLRGGLATALARPGTECVISVRADGRIEVSA